MQDIDEETPRLPNDPVDFELQQWQIEHIQQGIHDADAGLTVSHDDIKNAVLAWRGK